MTHQLFEVTCFHCGRPVTLKGGEYNCDYCERRKDMAYLWWWWWVAAVAVVIGIMMWGA